ncbi:MAG TPA: efflux RND transporter periplasmic adaptor subunit [Tepidisphaeraceae bacterium]|nr:efflux RND transporter periplasmic adaptor subunit [Tepidisphaeraceae bacterium]
MRALVIVALAAAVSLVLARRAASSPPAAPGESHKQLWHCGMHPQVIEDHPGNCPICGMALTPLNSSASADAAAPRKILYWWDPMLGPSSMSDHPGKSAMGMDLVPVYADSGGPEVQIDPAVVQNMGVRTAQVLRAPLKKTVRTIGLLSLPETGMHDVSLKIGGWIDKLYVDQEGMHVQKGQALLELYSPDLQVAGQELISARKALQSPGAAVPGPLREEAQKLLESARRKLTLWDIDDREIDAIAAADEPPKDVVFRSPATGHVEEKAIVQGSSVQPGMKLLRIADHSKAWLDMQIYEDQYPFVEMGQKVVASLDAIPGKTFDGTVTFIYPHLDHMSRTLEVRATLDNPDFQLKPGMYATVEILTKPVADAILCPREAVIDTGTRQIAFIAESGGHFAPRKVRTGLAGDNDLVQIVRGLAPGETVVTSGQFLLDVESRTIEATQKLGADAAALVTEAEPDTQPAAVELPVESKPAPEPVTTSPPAQPASRPANQLAGLTQIYCPMVKADWVQLGSRVANPYLGHKMPDCGDVRRQLPSPPPDSPLVHFVHAYIDVQKHMSDDALDEASVAKLKAAAADLPNSSYGPLRAATAKLAGASDLKAARDTFQSLSSELIAALDHPGK